MGLARTGLKAPRNRSGFKRHLYMIPYGHVDWSQGFRGSARFKPKAREQMGDMLCLNLPLLEPRVRGLGLDGAEGSRAHSTCPGGGIAYDGQDHEHENVNFLRGFYILPVRGLEPFPPKIFRFARL